ncbi:uncharacterized protein LOC118192409 [Stegodyphus dumicola]|uniref:uncharacterized protein LOC118192409 n=1 Tax=Stegodyphus dumicola TaxID=202533 RepID=UPI0015B0BE5C|nr:uncharacterized protein LOC118192409 [Stegodyphus dumicola]
MKTDTFIAALKRFIARRGRPEEMYSDCGTNFIVANRQLKSYRSDQKVARYLVEEKIKWNFNPPSAPHFGRLWEAAVKTIRCHMKRAIGAQVLTFEEFVSRSQGMSELRIIIAISSDPDDFSMITSRSFFVRNIVKGYSGTKCV